jgi:hypothetical protein
MSHNSDEENSAEPSPPSRTAHAHLLSGNVVKAADDGLSQEPRDAQIGDQLIF